MTLSWFMPRALLFALACGPSFGAGHDVKLAANEALRPRGDRVDRAWKRYRNSDRGYCVSYPSRWSKDVAFDGSGIVVETGLHRYSKPTGEIDIGPMTLPGPEDARLKPASVQSDNLDQDLEEHLNGLRKFARAEKMQVLDQHAMKVQGFSALYVKNQYYDPLERSNWMQEVVFIKRKGELYRMELQCPPEQIERFEPVFTYLVNTFEFDCTK